jgi:[acyl-carrier-protein] S-malonyltransferase
MGRALAEAYPEARDIFAQADQVLGFPLSQLCFEGPEAELTDTINQQPAILTTSIAALRAIEKRALDVQPAFVAGHSLGEFSALVACGALDFADAVRLVRERGRLMKKAGDATPGGMAAVLKLERDALEAICAEANRATGKRVQVANDNSPGQLVISGDRAALDKAMELARTRGARRVVPLAVSIAAHSHLMASIAAEFRRAVEAVRFDKMRVPVIGNVYARPIDALDLVDELEAQLTTPVLWSDTIRYLAARGVTRFVEVGPKDVLAGLVRRIDDSVAVMSVGEPDNIDLLLA